MLLRPGVIKGVANDASIDSSASLDCGVRRDGEGTGLGRAGEGVSAATGAATGERLPLDWERTSVEERRAVQRAMDSALLCTARECSASLSAESLLSSVSSPRWSWSKEFWCVRGPKRARADLGTSTGFFSKSRLCERGSDAELEL
jgi:hypothetical protein